MISRTECLVKAREARIAGFRTLSSRDRLLLARDVPDNEYPSWVRGLDKTAGDYFATAERFQRLADGPFWKRWLA